MTALKHNKFMSCIIRVVSLHVVSLHVLFCYIIACIFLYHCMYYYCVLYHCMFYYCVLYYCMLYYCVLYHCVSLASVAVQCTQHAVRAGALSDGQAQVDGCVGRRRNDARLWTGVFAPERRPRCHRAQCVQRDPRRILACLS